MNTDKHILIVDDNVSLCRIMLLILQSSGYNVTIANDGLEFLDYVRTEKYDFAIMDIRMPCMDGTKALSTLREYDSDLKVILMTAYPVNTLAKQELVDKQCRLIQKPFDMTDILKLIEEMTCG